MEAGRELDALIAEKVMGYRKRDGAEDAHGSYPSFFYWGGNHELTLYDSPGIAGFAPSMSMDYAWQVVEKLWHLGWTCFLNNADGRHICEFARMSDEEPFKSVEERGSTAPLAICLAALKIVTVSDTT